MSGLGNLDFTGEAEVKQTADEPFRQADEQNVEDYEVYNAAKEAAKALGMAYGPPPGSGDDNDTPSYSDHYYDNMGHYYRKQNALSEDLIYINQTLDFGNGLNIGDWSYGDGDKFKINKQGCGFAATINGLYDMGYLTEYKTVEEAINVAFDFLKNKKQSNGNDYYSEKGAIYPVFMNDFIQFATDDKYYVKPRNKDYNSVYDDLKNNPGAIVSIKDDGDRDKRIFDKKGEGTEGHLMYVSYDEKRDMFLVLNSNKSGSEDFKSGKIYFTYDEIYGKLNTGFQIIADTENKE